jgi:sugar lactone lactonase YvrE
MKLTRHNFAQALTMSVLFLFSAVHSDDYGDARAALVAAYQAEDYPAMQLAAQKALVARPEFPGALFNLAYSYALNQNHRDSLRILHRLLDKGIDFGAAELDEFAAVRELEGWTYYASQVDALYKPAGEAEVVATYPEADFIPEGIAIDANGHLLIGSIRTGQLIRLLESPMAVAERGGSWSVFGMRFHSDGGLWFASAAVPQLLDVGDESGKTGLFRIDVNSGEMTKAVILPQYESEQVLGDLIIADENTLYATDSLTGAIYRYYIDSNEFEALVERGELRSPQGLVLDESGGYLYVADYNGGLYRVALQDGSFIKLDIADGVSDYGIDGLYRRGDELIAIQNGIRPHRVVALKLSQNGLAITESRILASNLEQFDEPTLGVIHDDDFYFVANSHWNRFDQENKLPDGLSGPIVLKVSLD